MPPSAHSRPAPALSRPARGRVRARRALSIVLAGTAACAAGLVGLDALLVVPPAPAEAHAPPPADPRALAPFLGSWVSDAGAHLILARSGAVWADGPGPIGAARVEGARLVIEGAGLRCIYGAEPPRAEALDWRPLNAAPGSPCPTGRYARRHAF